MSRDPLGPVPSVLAAALGAWLVDLSWQGSSPEIGFLSVPHLAAMVLVAVAGAHLAHRARAPDGATPTVAAARVAAVVAALALPLDAWWHRGQVPRPEVLTPPHTLTALALGLLLGAASWAAVSRAAPTATALRRSLPVALLMAWMTAIGTEYLGRPNLWHGAEFYQIAAAAFPVVLVSSAISGNGRWTALVASAVYLGLLLLLAWGLAVWPLSPGAGQAPPVRLVTPAIPLLLVVPAAAIDWLVARAPVWRAGPGRRLLGAATTGAAFVALLVAAHWPTGDLLLGRAGWTVGADRWPYHAGPGGWRVQYWTVDPDRRAMAVGLGWAVALGTASVLVGYWTGRRIDSGKPT